MKTKTDLSAFLTVQEAEVTPQTLDEADMHHLVRLVKVEQLRVNDLVGFFSLPSGGAIAGTSTLPTISLGYISDILLEQVVVRHETEEGGIGTSSMRLPLPRVAYQITSTGKEIYAERIRDLSQSVAFNHLNPFGQALMLPSPYGTTGSAAIANPLLTLTSDRDIERITRREAGCRAMRNLFLQHRRTLGRILSNPNNMEDTNNWLQIKTLLKSSQVAKLDG